MAAPRWVPAFRGIPGAATECRPYSIAMKRRILNPRSIRRCSGTDVASRGVCGAVVLESGFSSASSVALSALPWLPRWLHFLGKNRFESARKLASVKSPVLIVHGDPDLTIPTTESKMLFASANEPKKLLIFRGAGHNVFGTVGEPYLTQVEQCIHESLTEAALPTARL